MDGLRRVVGLAGLLAAEVAVVVLLHRLGDLPWLAIGWDDPAAWLESVPVEDAVVAALRLAALVGAYWLAVTTMAYTLARACRLPAAVRSVEWMTLPAVRQVADRALAAALAGSTLAVGLPVAAAAGVVAPPAVTAPSALPDGPAGSAPAAQPDAPASPGAASPHDAAASHGGASQAFPAATRAPGLHVVAPGDNLWAIAAEQLGGSPAGAAIHGQWLVLIDANRQRLRSGDPDLIYPGEELVVPPTDR